MAMNVEDWKNHWIWSLPHGTSLTMIRLKVFLIFSRGARLTHLIAILHEASGGILFHGLKYVIMTSGYGGFPNPTNFPPSGEVWQNAGNKNWCDVKTSIPSMHIMGNKDRLIPVEKSRLVLSSYENPRVHEHACMMGAIMCQCERRTAVPYYPL